MSLRAFATALGKLAVSVSITVVAGVLIILQLQYPNTPPPYELVPTIVQIIGASALLLASHYCYAHLKRSLPTRCDGCWSQCSAQLPLV